jgi:hypothetical protein
VKEECITKSKLPKVRVDAINLAKGFMNENQCCVFNETSYKAIKP